MRNKFFFTSDRKIAINLDQVNAVVKDWSNYTVYLKSDSNTTIKIDVDAAFELFEALAEYKGE